jgi:hypothetical protein
MDISLMKKQAAAILSFNLHSENKKGEESDDEEEGSPRHKKNL